MTPARTAENTAARAFDARHEAAALSSMKRREALRRRQNDPAWVRLSPDDPSALKPAIVPNELARREAERKAADRALLALAPLVLELEACRFGLTVAAVRGKSRKAPCVAARRSVATYRDFVFPHEGTPVPTEPLVVPE